MKKLCKGTFSGRHVPLRLKVLVQVEYVKSAECCPGGPMKRTSLIEYLEKFSTNIVRSAFSACQNANFSLWSKADANHRNHLLVLANFKLEFKPKQTAWSQRVADFCLLVCQKFDAIDLKWLFSI